MATLTVLLVPAVMVTVTEKVLAMPMLPGLVRAMAVGEAGAATVITTAFTIMVVAEMVG